MRGRTLVLALVVATAACNGKITDVGGDDDDVGATADAAPGSPDAAPGSPDAAPGAGMYAVEAAFCVDETNRLRAVDGKPPVARSQALEDYAMEGAEFDFNAPASPPHPHFQMTGGGGIAFAENECPHQLGWNIMGDVRNTVAECIAAFYGEGPGGGHYDNMMGAWGSMGCGIYVVGTDITIVQDFGG
jgi:hypothetical protein